LISCFIILPIVKLPAGEKFSELYLLGSQKMAQDLPFNILQGKNYTVYLGVGNHLDSLAYYLCSVKVRNQTETTINDEKPRLSDAVYQYRTMLQNGVNWTVPLTFSFSEINFANTQSTLKTLTINDIKVNINKTTLFDQNNNGYYYQILVELWAFNSASGSFEYQNRSVYFWLNATSSV
jgi:uncharacterized membrane protein